MSTSVYCALENPDASWHCVNCGMPNFPSSLFDSMAASTSQVDYLADSSSLNSTLGSPGPPQHQSSPKRAPPTKASPNNIKVLVINFQSIRNKKEEFGTLVDQVDPDIVLGTETWLSPLIANSEIIPEGYEPYRKDREGDQHGGVFILVKKHLISERITIQEAGESVFATVELSNNCPLIIGAIYRPTNGDYEYIDKICSTIYDLANKHKNATLWLGGDFNLPDICWDTYQITGH
jgi:hypothetical protein